MSQIPAGWYPDPEPTSPRGASRWWDGTGWTEQVALAHQPHRGPTTPDGVRLAGWWWRVLATFVDGIIVSVITYLLTLPVQQDVQQETAMLEAELQRRIANGAELDLAGYFADVMDLYYRDHVLSLVVFPMMFWLLYYVGFLRYRGATPGKVVCGLRVRLRERPGRLPWSTIGVRMAVQYVAAWVLLGAAVATGDPWFFLGAGFLLFLFSVVDALWATGARRQTLHDLAARTVVVRPGREG